MPKPLICVTGGTQGIGKAVAAAFAAEGHPVLSVARHGDPDRTGDSPLVQQAVADVADSAALEAAIRAAEASHGPVECLVNNAGFLKVGPLAERDPAAMSYEIDALFKGVLNGIRAVLPGMTERRRGTIINISSIGDRVPGPQGEVYHASKAAIRSLSASLQKGQAANNVRIVNIAPGLIKTNIHADMGISFADYCRILGNPTFISAQELADIVMFCWRQPQHICIRDIVVMPTTSDFG